MTVHIFMINIIINNIRLFLENSIRVHFQIFFPVLYYILQPGGNIPKARPGVWTDVPAGNHHLVPEIRYSFRHKTFS